MNSRAKGPSAYFKGSNPYHYSMTCDCGSSYTLEASQLSKRVKREKEGKVVQCPRCSQQDTARKNTGAGARFGKYTRTPLTDVYTKLIARARKRNLPFSKKWESDFNQFRIHMKKLGWESGKCVMLKDEALGYVRGNLVLMTRGEAQSTAGGERIVFEGEEYVSLTALWEQMALPNVSYDTFLRRRAEGWPLRKALTSSVLDDVTARDTLTRKVVTIKLTAACIGHLVHKGFGCYKELALGSRRQMRRRADVIAVNLKGEIVLCEVKSSMADFQTDKKFHLYLPYCNRMYFVFAHTMDWKKLLPKFQHLGIGVMELQKDGLVRMVRPAKARAMDPKIERSLLMRMVWRGSSISQRTMSKRPARAYLEELVLK